MGSGLKRHFPETVPNRFLQLERRGKAAPMEKTERSYAQIAEKTANFQ
jgi:hypothetical protein